MTVLGLVRVALEKLKGECVVLSANDNKQAKHDKCSTVTTNIKFRKYQLNSSDPLKVELRFKCWKQIPNVATLTVAFCYGKYQIQL